MALLEHLTTDHVVDELKTQLRPLAWRGLKPDHIEMDEQYAHQLDGKFLRAHIVRISINEGDGPALGRVPIRRVRSPGILHVVV